MRKKQTPEKKAINYAKRQLDAHKVIIAYIRNDGTTALIGNTERPLTRAILEMAVKEIDEKYRCERGEE